MVMAGEEYDTVMLITIIRAHNRLFNLLTLPS
jgi:hypothetical protein